ncbi:MAG TPA: chemotaxis protein CheB [Dissulfurispiraceae bacterium]|nr:chemotaxis protein CheB [Dissulfurispiraceae bacterium]
MMQRRKSIRKVSTPPSPAPKYLVGIGASAGGLDALRPFIGTLKAQGSIAYIIAHHMSPRHQSILAELLARSASITVSSARDGDAVLPDCCYVIPPNYDALVRDGRLRLTSPLPEATTNPSIDTLFRSVADSHRDRAVGVILSGSGGDGTAGAEAIRAAGGIVLAQRLTEAMQPGMPCSAILADAVDLQLSAMEIAEYLNSLGAPQADATPLSILIGKTRTRSPFRQILEMVARATHLDVTLYKEATLRRQIEKRYRALSLSSLDEYLKYIQGHADELTTLQEKFLISVTSFFRDPSSFVALKAPLEERVSRKKPGESLRAWIPGCATGEEAYTFAIMLREIFGPRLSDFDVRVFATDISAAAIEFARAGLYSAEALEKLPPVVRGAYFSKEGGKYKVTKEVRELCVFSVHDVTRHPPFMRLDVISCRNLLIYFKPALQEALFANFHYALDPDGYLLLGNSESVGSASKLFETVDPENKLFRRKDAPVSCPVHVKGGAAFVAPLKPGVCKPESKTNTLIEKVHAALIEAYAPASILISASFDVLHFFSGVRRYLTLPTGSADFSLFALCLPELRSELKALCYRASQEANPSVTGMPTRLTIDGQTVVVRLVVRRVAVEKDAGTFALLVSFEERSAEEAKQPVMALPAEGIPEAASAEIERLRQELSSTREHLQALIEELEASNEELQSMNEELQSSSEELQSANEELQSGNEELSTLNDEMRVKSLELLKANTTLSNIQDSVQMGLVVVDKEGRITRFNALAVRIFGLMQTDIGQPLAGVPCHIELPRLPEQIAAVSESGLPIVERAGQGDRHYVMQISPYLDESRRITGAVLTFMDISELHRAESAICEREALYLSTVIALSEGIILFDPLGSIIACNPAAEHILGLSETEMRDQKKRLADWNLVREDGTSYPPDELPPARAIASAQPQRYVVLGIISPSGGISWLRVNAEPVLDKESGKIRMVVVSLADITSRKRDEKERRLTVEYLRLVNMSSDKKRLIRSSVEFFRQRSGCEAVGIRLKEGEDYPYYESRGFPPDFIRTENSLCTRDAAGSVVRNKEFNPVLACMCGNIISGRFDPSKSFFTAGGSFWSNNTTELLATTTDADRKARTRNRCNGEGYESVALIPLRVGESRLGLLQLNDRRIGRFSTEDIELWERLCGHLAVAVAKFDADEKLSNSEALYRSLFDNMLNGLAYCKMLFVDGQPDDFIYLAVNTAFPALTGLKDVVGKRVSEVISGIRESSSELFEIYGRVSQSGKPERFEIFVDALQMWFSISVYSPGREHFVAVFDVITERKKAELQLSESREKISLILNSAAEGIFGLDRSGLCTFCNASGMRMLGYRDEKDLIGKNMHDLVHHTKDNGTPHSRYDCAALGAMRTGENLHNDRDILWRADGTSFPAEYWAHPILKDGVIIGSVVTFVDISERTALQSQLLQAQKMESIGILAGGIAHDFNNILQGIIGNLFFLKQKSADADSAIIDEILGLCSRASDVTRGMLAYSRQQVFSLRAADLNAVVKSSIKLLIRVIGEDIEVRTEYSGEALPVLLDTAQIQQVMLNLATNARDAMPSGGVLSIATGRTVLDSMSAVSCGLERPGSYATITVSDFGTGIDGQSMQHIFEPFFTTKETGKGTGLGLAIVYGIIKQHEGCIDVKSAENQGTTFTIYLPLVASARAQEDAAVEPDVGPGAAHERPDGSRARILLVEDDRFVRQAMERLIETFGYEIVAFGDPQMALDVFRRDPESFDMVILDIIMPKKSGRELFLELLKIKSGVKGLFVSGYPADLLSEKGMMVEGVDVIMKPIDPSGFAQKIRTILKS